jgi:hypothetical protein
MVLFRLGVLRKRSPAPEPGVRWVEMKERRCNMRRARIVAALVLGFLALSCNSLSTNKAHVAFKMFKVSQEFVTEGNVTYYKDKWRVTTDDNDLKKQSILLYFYQNDLTLPKGGQTLLKTVAVVMGEGTIENMQPAKFDNCVPAAPKFSWLLLGSIPLAPASILVSGG